MSEAAVLDQGHPPSPELDKPVGSDPGIDHATFPGTAQSTWALRIQRARGDSTVLETTTLATEWPDASAGSVELVVDYEADTQSRRGIRFLAGQDK